MTKWTSALVLTLWVVVCTTGQDPQDPKKEKPKPYFPLGPEMSWTYDSPDGQFTLKAVKEETIGDEKQCILVETLKGGKAIANDRHCVIVV